MPFHVAPRAPGSTAVQSGCTERRMIFPTSTPASALYSACWLQR